jgi:hypothetical protein
LNLESLECRKLLTAGSATAADTSLLTAISDGNFEIPALTANTYQYTPNGSPWLFSGAAGITTNDSPFNASNPNSPDPNGTQVAFLQDLGSMGQSVYMDVGTYSFSFEAAQRAGNASPQAIQVSVNGSQVSSITPTTNTYASYQTASFTITTAGPQTVQFFGLDPQGGDSTALIDEVAITQTCAVNDSSFEVPALTANTYQYAPNGSPWQFSPSAGISSNGSPFTSGNPANAPDGTQVAFLQDTGSMSQSVYMTAGVYTLTYQAAQRAGYTTKHYQELQVLVDGSPVGTATPTSSYYGLYQTSLFTITTTGPHTIAFVGLNPTGGDNTAFVDEVAITGAGSSVNDGSFEWPEMQCRDWPRVPISMRPTVHPGSSRPGLG